jgi:hypothetical protein
MLSIPIERHTLDNGLTLVLAPDTAVPVVAVNLWYGVGSRHERPGRTGFAHLFEHMMFQGSKHVPKNAHFEFVERAGGSLNATTWFDRTNYFETLPSHQLELALWLESDRMGFFVDALTPETLRNQQEVVLNERRERYENQPYGDWDERLLRLLWPSEHPYHHTVIGEIADISAATLADVEDFFRTYYVPNNAVLTIAGISTPNGPAPPWSVGSDRSPRVTPSLPFRGPRTPARWSGGSDARSFMPMCRSRACTSAGASPRTRPGFPGCRPRDVDPGGRPRLSPLPAPRPGAWAGAGRGVVRVPPRARPHDDAELDHRVHRRRSAELEARPGTRWRDSPT